MSNITIEKREKVLKLAADGKKPAVIAMQVALSKSIVEQIISEGTAGLEVVTQPQATSLVADAVASIDAAFGSAPATAPAAPGSKEDKLAQMLAQAEVRQVAVEKVRKPRAARGPAVDKTKRDLVLIFSPSIKQGFLTTNLLYSNKTADAIVALAKTDLSKKKKLGELLAAPDLQADHIERQMDESAAEGAKAAKHAALVLEQYVMVSTCPKVAAPVAQAAPAPATEEVAE